MNKRQTILITRHDKIGDFITSLPMAKVLKQQTDAKIVFLVSKINISLASKFDFIDEVVEYSDDSFTLLKRLNKIKADISISAYIDFHLGLCLFLAKIPTRVAPATKIAQIFFNKTLKQRRSEVKKTEYAYNLDLLIQYDKNLNLTFSKPLLNLDTKRDNFVIFHCGSGGSSDGNLKVDDYLQLAKKISNKTKIVFTFGPDDEKIKDYIKKNLDFKVDIKDDFNTLWDFTVFIAKSKLFVSTSTGPMHLAGLTNTKTLSFFGDNLFASSKRWATISDTKYQNNYEVPQQYDKKFYKKIEDKLLDLV
jgi:ADP-heptose:LPS heptosyltransferase